MKMLNESDSLGVEGLIHESQMALDTALSKCHCLISSFPVAKSQQEFWESKFWTRTPISLYRDSLLIVLLVCFTL